MGDVRYGQNSSPMCICATTHSGIVLRTNGEERRERQRILLNKDTESIEYSFSSLLSGASTGNQVQRKVYNNGPIMDPCKSQFLILF